MTPDPARAQRLGLLVVGHGSRRPEANAVLRELAAAVARRARAVHAVRPAYLELESPTVGEGYAALVADGCDHIVVHPYFLYPGNHSTTDIPAARAAAQATHPEVGWTMTEPLSLDDRLVDLVLDRVAATGATTGVATGSGPDVAAPE